MITPLPQLPVPPLPSDAGGARPDVGEGEGFAEILAAAGALRPPPAMISPPPVSEGGPTIDGAPADAPLDAAAPLPETILDPGSHDTQVQSHLRPNARVFNQDGFFASAAAIDADAGAVPGRPAAPGLDAAAPANIAALAPLGEPLASGVTAVSARSAAASGSDLHLAPALRGARAAMRATGAPTPLRVQAFEPEVIAPATKSATAQRTRLRASAGARSGIEVVLHELEQGLHVAARVDALDEAQRRELHDEIAALLSRHGLAARTIRISGAASRASSQGRVK